MSNWQDTLTILGFLLSLISFIIAVSGTWGDIKGFVQNISLIALERKIKNKKRKLDEVKKFKEISYLVAYIAKKIIFILLTFFFIGMFEITLPDKVDFSSANFIACMVVSWLIGNLSGNAFRACNNVLNAEKIESKLTTEIDKLRTKTPQP